MRYFSPRAVGSSVGAQRATPTLPRILFVKTSSLGDVVHNCPAVTDVARHVPGAVIDWVVEEAFAGIATLHPQVRRVIPLAIRRWRGDLLAAATCAAGVIAISMFMGDCYDRIDDTTNEDLEWGAGSALTIIAMFLMAGATLIQIQIGRAHV